mmetsp:Transcript_19715/g.39240  ORF Transcript_19715/g.39240 Transcript_19715/m.39240 type:complete len:202 (+) Transcript_19715:168-773(+)
MQTSESADKTCWAAILSLPVPERRDARNPPLMPSSEETRFLRTTLISSSKLYVPSSTTLRNARGEKDFHPPSPMSNRCQASPASTYWTPSPFLSAMSCIRHSPSMLAAMSSALDRVYPPSVVTGPPLSSTSKSGCPLIIGTLRFLRRRCSSSSAMALSNSRAIAWSACTTRKRSTFPLPSAFSSICRASRVVLTTFFVRRL